MNLGILDVAQQAANEAAKAELLRLVGSGTTTLVVGAGYSAYLRYKTWWDLLLHYEAEAAGIDCAKRFVPDARRRSSLPLEYAGELEEFLNQHQPQWFRRQLELLYHDNLVPLKPFHRQLVQLPFKAIMTTNYDTALSRALVETDLAPGEASSFLLTAKGSPYLNEFLSRIQGYRPRDFPMRVFHIHGRYDQPDEAVLTAADYSRAYGYRPEGNPEPPPDWELRRKLLWALPAMSRLVFVGFSMEDPYFLYGLRTVSQDLWTTNTPVHYALMGISSESKADLWARSDQLRRLCAVQVVFAEEPPGSYQGLPELIGEIADYCHSSPPARQPAARHEPFRPNEDRAV
jgi:hypothetical protein